MRQKDLLFVAKVLGNELRTAPDEDRHGIVVAAAAIIGEVNFQRDVPQQDWYAYMDGLSKAAGYDVDLSA